MHALVARRSGRSNGECICRAGALAPWLACLIACNAWASDGEERIQDVVLAQAVIPSAARTGPQVEVTATTLPRLDSAEPATRASRVDMTWFATRQSPLGLSLAMSSIERVGLAMPGLDSTAPGTDLGLHWRHQLDGNYRLDFSAWRRIGTPDAASLLRSREPGYGARVEMAMAAAPRSGFVADRGFLGFQLEGGGRITLRKGGGGKPMVYYRSKF